MYKNNRKYGGLVRLVALVMVVVLALPVHTKAATAEPIQPYASSYLDSYNAYVYPAGNGKIQVWFTVTGTRRMDTLGTLTIKIYQSTNQTSWTWVESFTNDITPSMLGYDTYYHSGHVDYQGVAGRYYRAYVCVWAGKDGGGDTRYFYTSGKLAT